MAAAARRIRLWPLPETLPALAAGMAGEVFTFRGRGRRTPRSCLLYLVALVAIAILVAQPRIAPHDADPPRRGHALLSIEYALTHQACGKTSMFYHWPTPNYVGAPMIGHLVRDDPAAAGRPMREVVAERFGGMDAYCAAFDRPHQLWDLGLQALIGAGLWLHPGMSFTQLGYFLYFSKLAAVVGVVGAMLWWGAPLLYLLLALVAYLVMIDAFHAQYYHSVYPFIPVIIAAQAAHAAWLAGGALTRWRGVLVHPLLAGASISLAAHFRISLLFVALAVYLAAVLIAARDLPRLTAARLGWTTRLAAVVAVLVLAAAGYAAAGKIVFEPLKLPAAGIDTEAITHHPMSHMLIIGLASPEPGPVALREGIEGSDMGALALAQRLDPDVRYESRHYEKLLWAFYINMWLFMPAEAAATYAMKADRARDFVDGLCTNEMSGAGVPGLCGAQRLLFAGGGGLMILGYAAVAAGAAAMAFCRRSPLWALLMAGSVAAFLLHVEMVLTITAWNTHLFIAWYWMLVFLAVPFAAATLLHKMSSQ